MYIGVGTGGGVGIGIVIGALLSALLFSIGLIVYKWKCGRHRPERRPILPANGHNNLQN